MNNRRLTALILVILMLFQTISVMGATVDNLVSEQLDFEFPEVTRQQFKAELQKAIEKGHPYIIANKEHIDKVKEYAFGKDEFLTEQYAILKANAEKIIATDITRIDDNIAADSSFIGDATQIMNEAPVLGLIYLVEGDTRYAQRLYNQMEHLCTLESWGTRQRLDFSFITFAIAICYDWLHDWLSQEQKDILINGLKRHNLDVMMTMYRDPNDPRYQTSHYKVIFNTNGNHNVMISSKAFIAAMAFADTDIDYMAEFMENSAKYFTACVSHLYPDGIWDEGLSYWTYVGPPTARWLQSMISAFGHAFGYEDISFMKKLANYPICCTSEQGSFIQGDTNFTDSNAGSPIYYMMGKLAGDKALQTHAVENAKIYKNPDATLILMYDPEMSYDEGLELDKDMLLRGSLNIATMRSTFAGQQYTFAGMSVRETTSNWTHVDRGTLALDALGERWITNNSRETYYHGYNNGSGNRFNWYRARTEAQSCIVINPSAYRGQELNSDVVINTFDYKEGGAYAISDLTKAYETQVKSYHRGIQLADNRKVFIVQDEVVMKEPSEMYSFFNIYDADIEILNDGKSAILHKNNKKVYVSVDCDEDFTLDSMAAEPLPTSPVPDSSTPNSSNSDFNKLFIHLENVNSANIRVCFMPYICNEELSAVTCKDFVPMSEWSVPDELKTLPVLEDIKINGKSLEGFNPYNRCYDTKGEFSIQQITPIYDNTKYKVTLNKDEQTGAINILMIDKLDSSNMNSYSLLVPIFQSIETTYTNSGFRGIMRPQEFYRIAYDDNLSVMYFSGSAPQRCKKAILTVYVEVVGDDFDTNLKLCELNAGTEFKYLAGSNTPISKKSVAKVNISALDNPVLTRKNMQKLEYDISSVLPQNGGDFEFALFPVNNDEDYINVASHRNSDYSLRPNIRYYY